MTPNMKIIITYEPNGQMKLVEFAGDADALEGLASKIQRAARGDDADGVVIEGGGVLVVFRRTA